MARRPLKRQGIYSRLEQLYERMDQDYIQVASAAGLTCAGCPDNCCVSYFQHHTYIEWAYLWRGLAQLPRERLNEYCNRAKDYVRQAQAMRSRGFRPRLLCPLNDDGRCGVYEHRLMICRLHGTANLLALPGQEHQIFPGCWRFQELTSTLHREDLPILDRTPLYQELARLEMDFLGKKRQLLPRVDLTLAQMLVEGPPKFS